MTDTKGHHYGEHIDPIVYGPETQGWGPHEWILMAKACLDQATHPTKGLTPRGQAAVEQVIAEHMPPVPVPLPDPSVRSAEWRAHETNPADRRVVIVDKKGDEWTSSTAASTPEQAGDFARVLYDESEGKPV